MSCVRETRSRGIIGLYIPPHFNPPPLPVTKLERFEKQTIRNHRAGVNDFSSLIKYTTFIFF